MKDCEPQAMTPRLPLIVCVMADPAERASLVDALLALYREALGVEGFAAGADLLAWVAEAGKQELRIPLVIAGEQAGDRSGEELLLRLHELPRLRSTRKVLAARGGVPALALELVNRGVIDGFLPEAWQPHHLAAATYHPLRSYLLDLAPGGFDDPGDHVDVEALQRAFHAAEDRSWSANSRAQRFKRSFFTNRGFDDEALESAMIEEIDKALGRPEREHIEAGTVLLREGQPVQGIWILISGQVKLYRMIDGREVVFHAQTVGRIIGLMALSYRRTSFFSCDTVTDVVGIPVSYEDLDGALQTNPMLSIHFVTVLLRSLARRARRSVELQTEIDGLNRTLSKERDQLAHTLNRLKQAQTRLVESEKMATLGQLAAGVAHELNNPVAAIKRAADFMVEDVTGLVTRHPDGKVLASVLETALTANPLATRDERHLRGQLQSALGDERLARRLVRVGIHTPEAYRGYLRDLSHDDPEVCLSELEHYYKLGASLKNILTCAERIGALVKSLRSYARPEKDVTPEVDLRVGLDDTVLLFGHELKNVEVIRQYGEIPSIPCRAGEINQVWTNLISNALEAMDGSGVLRIETAAPDEEHVEVRIVDDGPGIRPENLEPVFDVNFTTRQGPAAFGLGIGLPICREIVDRHGGSITVASQPGRTCFTVVLPVRQAEGINPAVGMMEK